MMVKDSSNSFMSKYALLTYASVMAVLLGAFAVYRIETQKKDFDAAVKVAHQKTAGYDVQFIEMVNRLEDLLAERASFGYAGNRDPMTGATRMVAVRQPVVARRALAIGGRPAAAAATSVADHAPVRVMEEADPVRLTAIIYDNTRKSYTAVVMDGSRSLSVDVGDRVVDRRVTRITHDEIQMENDHARYVYNILGGNTKIPK